MDKIDVHPSTFCVKCFAATGHKLRIDSNPSFSVVLSFGFNIVILLVLVSVCSVMSEKSIGGRDKIKGKNVKVDQAIKFI